MKRLDSVLSDQIPLQAWKSTDCHGCRLGRWYYGEGMQQFGTLASFKALQDPHTRVHDGANLAVQAHAEGRPGEARQNYDRALKASKEVVSLLDDLKREAEAHTSVAV